MTGIERHWAEEAEREAITNALTDADRAVKEATGKFDPSLGKSPLKKRKS